MGLRDIYWKIIRAKAIPPQGSVDFGDFRRLKPVGGNWGLDRGLPVDRYYIENFLNLHSQDIQGDVLEVGDDRYSRQFGKDRIQHLDVLHYQKGNRQATIVADLRNADVIDSNRYDCLICVQTLQYIYELKSVAETLHRILKPGGVLLATFPGITSLGDNSLSGNWCWAMTSLSGRKLFEEMFSADNLEVKQYGNLLSATSFLQGLATEELRAEELDFCDIAYPVIISVRAKKEAGPSI